MKEKLRWWVANRLDRRPGWCWARLVTWALGRGPVLRECRVDAICHRDATANESCYCGKIKAAS